MTPDVNILVAASRADHPHHTVARQWLESALHATETGSLVEILPMVGAGFLRVVTHPRVFLVPTPLAEALGFPRAVLSRNGVTMPQSGREWPVLERLCANRKLAGNDLPDAWIAAATIAHGLHLVSFDRGFARFLPRSQLTLLDARD